MLVRTVECLPAEGLGHSRIMLNRSNSSLDVGVTFPSTELTRLYREARQNELRLQSDLDTAREIQGQLPKGARLIPCLELAAACVSTHELGGDFYVLSYGTGRLALAVGNVSGKRTAALSQLDDNWQAPYAYHRSFLRSRKSACNTE